MGKKSRLKRERRDHQVDPLSHFRGNPNESNALDAVFRERFEALSQLFAKFDPIDVIVALGVSELWLPNRASQVKHTFALQVAISMRPEQFTPERRLDTFDEFRDFAAELQRLVPSNPMLEDFVPEADWGDIFHPVDETIQPIFYGCNVERIPDFVEAFGLLRADEPQALADMSLALKLQANVIRSIQAIIAGDPGQVRPGHIETPSEEFWSVCRETLLSTCGDVKPFSEGTSAALTVELGAIRSPNTWEDFGSCVMMGTAMPHLIVQIGQRRFPVSPRSTSTVVIDIWDSQTLRISTTTLTKTCRRIGAFLKDRLRKDCVTAGPIEVVGTSKNRIGPFAAVISTGKNFHFFLLVRPEELPQVAAIEVELKRLIDDASRWGLVLPDVRQVVEFRQSDGRLPRSSEVQVVAVLAAVSTQYAFLELPSPSVRVLGLPDFVSLFDSLKDVEELDRYWSYLDQTAGLVEGLGGSIDHFAAFRDSHAVLIDGAITPDFIALDPHWNSSWRFKELKSFWEVAPRWFPDGRVTWFADEKSDGLVSLRSKGPFAIVWSGTVGATTFQVQMNVDTDELDLENGPILELFVHCLADAVTQRGDILARLPLFQLNHIVMYCQFNKQALVSLGNVERMEERAELPLLNNWRLDVVGGTKQIFATVEVNLARVQFRLEEARDASFEVECTTEAVRGLSAMLGLPGDAEAMELLQKTSARQPRFTTQTTERQVDVPSYANPEIPRSEHYKLARRDLAVVLKNHGVAAPARYELERAKVIMNAARDSARQQIHAQVARLNRKKLLLFCVEQHDRLTANYDSEVSRMKLSLSHEVSFDRSSLLADAHEKFVGSARNYRYLLECCLSLPGEGESTWQPASAIQLVAAVDWLSVLYEASDTLHNDIDVGGLELDESYVPTVYFSEGRESREREFLHSVVSAKIGIGLLKEDEVNSNLENSGSWPSIDEALSADVGFSFTYLLQTLFVLTRWHSVGQSPELQFSYSATTQTIANELVAQIPTLTTEVANKLIAFLTLDPLGVRRLVGKDTDEPDVPVWEHTKRVHRYLIRPLVRTDMGTLTWGAATVHRTSMIWAGSIFDGYLPADFAWPNMVKAVRKVKESIEKSLEVRAFEVISRVTPYAILGLDLRRRFPKEGFENVGDFDVLAYWPERSLWLSIECKYNQPPFCLKDARRLQERIFGPWDGHWHMQKIERRRIYLALNVERVRHLLGWPEGLVGDAKFREAYVCRDIYWSMRHPPYKVSSEFVRIDALDLWVRAMIEKDHGHGSIEDHSVLQRW